MKPYLELLKESSEGLYASLLERFDSQGDERRVNDIFEDLWEKKDLKNERRISLLLLKEGPKFNEEKEFAFKIDSLARALINTPKTKWSDLSDTLTCYPIDFWPYIKDTDNTDPEIANWRDLEMPNKYGLMKHKVPEGYGARPAESNLQFYKIFLPMRAAALDSARKSIHSAPEEVYTGSPVNICSFDEYISIQKSMGDKLFDWVGKIRSFSLAKIPGFENFSVNPNDPNLDMAALEKDYGKLTIHVSPDLINVEAEKAIGKLRGRLFNAQSESALKDLLPGERIKKFAAAAADGFLEISKIHPFRMFVSFATRLFIEKLAKTQDLAIDWSKNPDKSWRLKASIEYEKSGDTSLMEKGIEACLSPIPKEIVVFSNRNKTVKFHPDDLPIKLLSTTSLYTYSLVGGLKRYKDKKPLSPDEIEAIDAERKALFIEYKYSKNSNYKEHGLNLAIKLGLDVRDGEIYFPWNHNNSRINDDTNFFSIDKARHSIIPADITNTKSNVIVFTSGVTFSEKTDRIEWLSADAREKEIASTIFTQIDLISNLIPNHKENNINISSFNYYRENSPLATTAMVAQTGLEQNIETSISARKAFEAIFIPKVMDNDGRILPYEQVLKNMNGICLVGCCIGSSIIKQTIDCLVDLLKKSEFDDLQIGNLKKSFLIVNIAPPNTPPINTGFNMVSVMSRNDEFICTSNNSKALSYILNKDVVVPNVNSIHDMKNFDKTSYNIVFSGAGVITEQESGKVFDPVGTHFGHNTKIYTHHLEKIGFGEVIQAALEQKGPYAIGDLIRDRGLNKNANMSSSVSLR